MKLSLVLFNAILASTLAFSDYGGQYFAQCPQIEKDLAETRSLLTNMNDGILESLCGNDGNWNCTTVVVYSDGLSAVKQPGSFGLYFLYGLTEENGYPSFYRPADSKYLFYRTELGEWEYWHQYERWVIGPIHNRAVGGIMIKPYNPLKKCPWHIKWFRSNSWYHDVRRENMWNREGNPWVLDNTIRVECYSPERWPTFDCGCDRINVTGDGRVMEYHPDRLGEYTRLGNMKKEGYLAPVYAKTSEGPPSYLYSHDIQGRVWFMGSTTSTWSLRLNLLETEHVPECPFYPRPPGEDSSDYYDERQGGQNSLDGIAWEYLQSKKGEKEVWLKDFTLSVTCLR